MNDLRELDPQRTLTRCASAIARAAAFPGLVTHAVPEKPPRATRVREADSARQVYELWDTAGAPPAGAEAPSGRVTRVGSSARGEEDGDARNG